MTRLAITGANSSVGHNLLKHIASDPELQVLALLRSPSAIESLPKAENIKAIPGGYRETDNVAERLAGVDTVIHLAGVLFESRRSSYHQANVESVELVTEACRKAGVKHFILISVLGADASVRNPYFRSKGQAEQAARASGLNVTIVRTPMLLSLESAGGKALVRNASGHSVRVLAGGKYTLQPLDTDDLSRALLLLARQPASEGTVVHELAGPEALQYRDLIKRMALKLGKRANIKSVPLWNARFFAMLAYTFRGEGMSPAIVEVITTDENLEQNADQKIGITLTPLEETLEKLMPLDSTT